MSSDVSLGDHPEALLPRQIRHIPPREKAFIVYAASETPFWLCWGSVSCSTYLKRTKPPKVAHRPRRGSAHSRRPTPYPSTDLSQRQGWSSAPDTHARFLGFIDMKVGEICRSNLIVCIWHRKKVGQISSMGFLHVCDC